MDLKKSKSDFSNVANDLTGNNKNSSRSGLQKNFNGSDYEAHQYNFRISEIPNTAPLQHEFSLNKFSDAHIASPGKPPRA
jgi:hypothetical protein